MKVNFRYISEYNSEYSQRKAELIEYILDKDYGSTISFEKCAKILCYNIENEKELKKFRNTMSRIKNFLIEKGYILKTISNVGYYILKPKQISSYCYHTYIRRTENLLNKSNKILNYVETINLSDIRKEELNNIKDLNSDLISELDLVVENSNYYNKKSYYDNLED